MANENIELVRQAEKQADDMEAEARAECHHIMAEAEKRVQQILQDAEQQAKQTVELRCKQAEEKAAEYRQNVLNDAGKKLQELDHRAGLKEKEAAEELVRFLIS